MHLKTCYSESMLTKIVFPQWHRYLHKTYSNKVSLFFFLSKRRKYNHSYYTVLKIKKTEYIIISAKVIYNPVLKNI